MATINKPVTLTAAFGPGYASLVGTVAYTVYNGDGSTFQARTVAGIAEAPAGTGNYRVLLAATVFTAAFDGYVVWDTGGSSPVYTAPEDILVDDQIPAIKAKTDLLGVSSVSVASPVATDGTVSIVIGDDYLAADGRALQWISSRWVPLTSAAITFSCPLGDGTTLTRSGTVAVDGSSQIVSVELTAVQTGELNAGVYSYSVEAQMPSDDIVTLATGTLIASS